MKGTGSFLSKEYSSSYCVQILGVMYNSKSEAARELGLPCQTLDRFLKKSNGDNAVLCDLLQSYHKNKQKYTGNRKITIFGIKYNSYKEAERALGLYDGFIPKALEKISSNCFKHLSLEDLIVNYRNYKRKKEAGIKLWGYKFQNLEDMCRALGMSYAWGQKMIKEVKEEGTSLEDKIEKRYRYIVNKDNLDKNIKEGTELPVLSMRSRSLDSYNTDGFFLLEGSDDVQLRTVSDITNYLGISRDQVRYYLNRCNGDMSVFKDVVISEREKILKILAKKEKGEDYLIVDKVPFTNKTRYRLSYNGSDFSTIYDIRVALGCTHPDYLMRLLAKAQEEGKTLKEKLEEGDDEEVDIPFVCKKYKSAKEAKRDLKIDPVVWAALRSEFGGFNKEFLTRIRKHLAKSNNHTDLYIYKEVKFSSASEMGNCLNIPKTKLLKLNAGVVDDEIDAIIKDLNLAYFKNVQKNKIIKFMCNKSKVYKDLLNVEYRYSDNTGMCYFIVEHGEGTIDYLSNKEMLDICGIHFGLPKER